MMNPRQKLWKIYFPRCINIVIFKIMFCHSSSMENSTGIILAVKTSRNLKQQELFLFALTQSGRQAYSMSLSEGPRGQDIRTETSCLRSSKRNSRDHSRRNSGAPRPPPRVRAGGGSEGRFECVGETGLEACGRAGLPSAIHDEETGAGRAAACRQP